MPDLFDQETQNPPSLIPERIKEAREGKGYAAEEFADAIGVTRQALAQFEKGQARPRPDVLSRIIGETGQPLSFFTRQKRHATSDLGQPFWRSLARTGVKYRHRTVRRLEWALEITKHIESYINLPAVNLPEVDFDPDWPESQWTEAVERIADALRKQWSLGNEPIDHIEKHIEANGIILVQDKVMTDDMDAVSRWQSGRPYIFYAKEVKSAPRNYFNLAHELGHILLHTGVEVNSKNLRLLEKQADRFAGAFLLPRKTFSREALRSSLNYFMLLKKRWKVSIAAMVYRSKDLGILSENQAKYLWQQMRRENIREKEPLDDFLPVPEPSLLRDAAQMLFNHGVESKQQFRDAVILNREDMLAILGADDAMFERSVIPLSLTARAANDSN